MRRPAVVRVLLALALVIPSSYIALSSAPRLGLDLSGGTQIVLETRDAPGIEANAESTDRALEVLRERVDALGVTEPVNTGLSTLMVLAALLLLGGDSLADFALALLLGIVVGTCSTVSITARAQAQARSDPAQRRRRGLSPTRRPAVRL